MIKQLCDALFEQTPNPSVYGRIIKPQDCWPIRIPVSTQASRSVPCQPRTLLQWKKALTPENAQALTGPPLPDSHQELSMFKVANPNKWSRYQMKFLELLATETIVQYCQHVNSVYHAQNVSLNDTIQKLWPRASINNSTTFDLVWHGEEKSGFWVNDYGTWICPLDFQNTSEQLCWLARWQNCYESIEFVAPLSSGFPYLETFVLFVGRKPGVGPETLVPEHTSHTLYNTFLHFWRQVMRRVRWNMAVTQDTVPFQSNNVVAIADWYTFWSTHMPMNSETVVSESQPSYGTTTYLPYEEEDIPDYCPTSPVHACPNSPTIHDSLAPF